MQYKWLDHVVIVVRDVMQAAKDYERLLGIPAEDAGREFPDRGYRHAVFTLGESKRFIQLCEPSDDTKQAGAAMRRKLDEHGEGLQNIALAVDDVDAAMEEAKRRGVDVIRSQHSRSFFLHPRMTHGVLIQILQR